MSKSSQPPIPDEIRRYYDQVPEERRLLEGPSQLELARTQEVVLAHLPEPPADILDVGGAAGAYSQWMATKGYRVCLIEPVPRLVEEARRRSEASASEGRWQCQVGDARQLEVDDASADAVLLLGPLYHLALASDRLRALREARRALRPGGVVFAAGISRFASALDGLARDLFADPEFGAIVARDLKEGQHRNETARWDYFTTAYFHRPEELRDEVVAAGFECEKLVGLEGPGWILADFQERWSDPRKKADLLRVARALESEASIIGASAHLLAVGRKKGKDTR